MANWIEMQVATVRPTGRNGKFAYEIQLDIASPDSSKWILIPEDVSEIAVALEFTGGARAKVQTTLSKVDVVQEKVPGTIITQDWPNGVVNENCVDVCLPVTAIRLVNTVELGSVKIEVRAQ